MNKSLLFKTLSMVLLIAIVLSFAGCDKSNVSETTVTPNETDAVEATTIKAIDPMAKYDPGITLTAVRFEESTNKFIEGEDWDNNIYTRAWKEELGITIENSWVVPKSQYDQRLNIAIASGDLPDIIWADIKTFSSLVENEYTYDLTDIYENYATDFTKDIMAQDLVSFNTAKKGDKLMAIPAVMSAIDQCPILYYRSDWAEKLKIAEPTTLSELLDMSTAFTNSDPDGNGANDTFGLGITKSFIGDNIYGLAGYFAGYHGYPRVWMNNGSSLVYGSVQPEVKIALGQLQTMYINGEIDKEFGVKDTALVGESIAAGKVGIMYGPMWAPLAEQGKTIANDANAEWKALPLLSFDASVAKPNTAISIDKYFVINKDCENPEALIKLLNFFNEKSYGATANNDYGINTDGIQTFQYSIITAAPVKKNLIAHDKIAKAFADNDPSTLNVEETGYYNQIVTFNAGDNAGWGMTRVFGSPSSFDVIGKYVQDDVVLFNAFYGSPTETMAQRQATLNQLEEEVFTEIIMGGSLDKFDAFVADWNKLGGEQITKEVNDWAEKTK